MDIAENISLFFVIHSCKLILRFREACIVFSKKGRLVMPRWSRILDAVTESKTVAISDKARQMQQSGIDVINLGGGDPNFDTPPDIAEAGIAAIKKGLTHYVSSQGMPEFRRAIAGKFLRENGLDYDPDKEIIATASGKLALYIALMSLVDPGDEVLVIEPAWVSYIPLITLLGGRAVPVSLDPADDFTLTKEAVEAAITPRTKAILSNSPNNPCGRVLREDELAVLRDAAIAHDLWLVSDEIYEHLIYDGRRHVSPAALPDMRERCVVVNGVSKAYAMTGWRLGYLGAPAVLAEQILKAQQHVITCAASFAQVAGAEALNGSQDCVAAMRAEYDQRRIKACGALNAISGVRCPRPEGAFYLFPEIDFRGYDSWQLADFLLDRAGVAVTPGQAFASKAVRNVRMTFATSMENLMNAAQRIKEALANG
jgi:aspartate aminotransferase